VKCKHCKEKEAVQEGYCDDCFMEYEACMDSLKENSLDEWVKWHGR